MDFKMCRSHAQPGLYT